MNHAQYLFVGLLIILAAYGAVALVTGIAGFITDRLS